MGYYLTIDQGNSSAKVVVWHDDKAVSERSFGCLSPEEAGQLIESYGIDAAIYCSVAQTGEDLVGMMAGKCKRVINLTHLTPMPIVVDYGTPASLGRDRIAAAVGAHVSNKGRTVLVVDIGTAVTYDVVDRDGHFVGGNIAPGIKMRLDAMHHFTARLPRVEADGETPLWGRDTVTAMRAGAIHGVVAEIVYFKAQLPDDAKVVVTGGWAQKVAPMLDFECEIDALLVNRGLKSILRYNETK